MRRRYDKAGILALYPQAFWDLFVETVDPQVTLLGDVAVVEIRGPLEHHSGWWADSYEAIVDRVTDACATPVGTIVLKIDSPGGELMGCFDAARTIRARAAAAGKKLFAYVDGCACSAAYALACSAERIYTSDTGFLGSIGILITRVDATKRDTAMGVEYALVASGKRKVDGNPHASLAPDELAAMQAQCDSLASLFFELVASLRGVSADDVAGLEADVFHGVHAVEHRLADAVCTFDDLLAGLSAGAGGPMAEEKKDEETTEAAAESSSDEEASASASSEVDQARALLEEAAKGEGDEAERARKALEVLDAAGDDDEDDDGETASSSSARSSGGRRVSASMAGGLADIVARQGAELAELRRERERDKVSALLASRPDLEKGLAAYLRTKPLAEVKSVLGSMPKPAAPKPAATATVGATRGKGQESPADGSSPARDPRVAAAFSRGASSGGVKMEGETRQVFGIRPPRQTAADDAGKGSAA